MSMLSSMTAKLRKTAYEVEHVKNNNADWLWRDSITLADAAMQLRDAADTIARLRNTCHDLQHENEELNAENAKLRERVSELEELTDHRHYIPQEWYATLQAENEKLRELVSHLMYVKPADVTAIAHDGKLLRFDEMLAEVGMRFEVDDAPDEPMSDAARRVFDRLMSELDGDSDER